MEKPKYRIDNIPDGAAQTIVCSERLSRNLDNSGNEAVHAWAGPEANYHLDSCWPQLRRGFVNGNNLGASSSHANQPTLTGNGAVRRIALRQFLGVPLDEDTPDHSTLTYTRRRLPAEVFDEVFQFVLKIAAAKKLLSGQKVGVESTTLEANAAMKSIACPPQLQLRLRKLIAQNRIDQRAVKQTINKTSRKAAKTQRNRKGVFWARTLRLGGFA